LAARPGKVVAAWHTTYKGADMLANLENCFLLVARMGPAGAEACRCAGTLEVSDIGQQRIYFSSDNLVRVKTGRRRNLVVKPFQLRYEEAAVPAGLRRRLEIGTAEDQLQHTRDGDIVFLRQLEHMLAGPVLQTAGLPLPVAYKKVRGPDQVQPRLTGALIARLRDLGGTDDGATVPELFQMHAAHFGEPVEGGGMVFPFADVSGRGITMLDLSQHAQEAYAMPAEALDMVSDLYRVDIARRMGATP